MTPDDIAAAGLRLHVDGPVATITLDRPEVRNAQTPTMWRALAAIGREIPDDVRVVVVRGEGSSFSAGLDRAMLAPGGGDGQETVAGLLAKSDEEMSATIDDYQQGFTFLRDPRFVSIAAVQGHAIGAGFQLALSCDLRVVAEDVQFSMKESTLGLVPDLTGTKPLVESVGYARALEICATARTVGAAEALEIGLVTVAVPTADLDATVADLVSALTAPMPGAVRETKALLQAASGRSLSDQRRFEREAQVRRFRELAGLAGRARTRVGRQQCRSAWAWAPRGATCAPTATRSSPGSTAGPSAGCWASPGRTARTIAAFLAGHGHRRGAGRGQPAAGAAAHRRRDRQGQLRAGDRAGPDHGRSRPARRPAVGRRWLLLLAHRRGPDLRPAQPRVRLTSSGSRWPSSPGPRPGPWCPASTTT